MDNLSITDLPSFINLILTIAVRLGLTFVAELWVCNT